MLLLLLGFIQLVVGVILVVFTLGAGDTIGMGLIAEGSRDIIRAVKHGIINRGFNWVTWVIEKAIRITVLIIRAGFKAIKDCAKTVYSAVKTAISMVTGEIPETVKEGWQIVAKRVRLELAKVFGKEIVKDSVNYDMDNLTSSIDKSVEHEMQLYKSYNRVLHNQDIGYKDPMKKKEHVNRPWNEAIKQASLTKTFDTINRAREGGPSGLVHLGSLSDAADCPIEVYNMQGKLLYVIGDTKKGTPAKVEYHEPKNWEKTGHYTLPGGNEPKIAGGGSNMCLYNVVAQQKGLDPNALKNSTLNIMADNVETLSKQMSDIVHLEIYCRTKLTPGGVACGATNPNGMERYLTNSDGETGFSKTDKHTKGHPLHHVPYKRTLRDHLEATSEELQTNIAVYDAKGELLYTVGNYKMKDGKEPIKFEYYAPEGDKSGERLMSIGGKEEYRLNDPSASKGPAGMDYWRILGKMTGKNPDALKTNITQRMDAKSIPSHKSYERTTYTHFEATSVVLKRNVEVYNAKGKRLRTIGHNKKEVDKEPLKFEYRPPQGDKPGEYVSILTDGKEQYRFVDPPLANCPPEEIDGYWSTLGKMTKQDPDTLKSSITERMDAKMPRISCVEEVSRNKPKTGFISSSEANYVSYYVMQHPVAKAALAKLNEYEEGVKDSNDYIFQEITLSADDLNMPRTAWGAEWRNGKICHAWPITGDIEIKLQHYQGKQTDRDADVHIQTIFPRDSQSMKHTNTGICNRQISVVGAKAENRDISPARKQNTFADVIPRSPIDLEHSREKLWSNQCAPRKKVY